MLHMGYATSEVSAHLYDGIVSAVSLSCAALTYFDRCHSVPACFQNDAYTACCHSLSQPTDNASSDQNILHCEPLSPAPFVSPFPSKSGDRSQITR